MSRPALGQRVRTKDRLGRFLRANGGKEWVRQGGWWAFAKPAPIDGIYIGYRTYANGRSVFSGGWIDEWHPDKYFEVWLIVPNERQNPVPVLPEDVEVEE